jgi:hypothetical protein
MRNSGGEIPTKLTDFIMKKKSNGQRTWPGKSANTRHEKKRMMSEGEVTEEDFAGTFWKHMETPWDYNGKCEALNLAFFP